MYTLKPDKKSNVEQLKARLMAKICSLLYGVNYTETYLPVVRYLTIRMAAIFLLYLHRMDVSTAYLNRNLSDVFMTQSN